MTDPAFEIVVQGFQFCEAPRADREGCVLFSDLTGGGLYRVCSDGAVETILAARDWIGGATLDRDDAVLCSGRGGLVLVRNGIAKPILEAMHGRSIIAVNDIEADAAGAIYGGTIDFAAILEREETPGMGALFHLTPGGALTILRDDVVASNGIGFSPDGAIMYHAETGVGIWAWTMRNGVAAGPPALFAKADDCDGLAIDVEGGVWAAFWAEAVLRRYRADATVDRVIALPFPSLVSLSFGGPDLMDLYVTTGGNAARPQAGGVIRIRSDVPGLAPHRSAFSG